MQEVRYIISEASKKVDVEQHTLRYWEEELDLHIPRNEMGHRYYREEDIEILKAVRILKEKGYQLRAIKILLPELKKEKNLDENEIGRMKEEWDKKYVDELVKEEEEAAVSVPEKNLPKREEGNGYTKTEQKLGQFKAIMQGLFIDALRDNNELMADTVSENVTDHVIKEMDYLLRIKEEREEERYKQFDRTLRELQLGRSEAAAGLMKKRKKAFGKPKKF
ncbi:DNA-binding transcriptional regulator, MerR family [Anaerocolumna jejuensis DSM 15929]|uniref:DNA-binding transcriptional regulator, MerR family n=1 Tax=Anaerocolumna jejuensis DSM 15929 TaxID=1121322 RepID=A0A1M6V1K8_9FIRM|nr:helix-turn-helix domain-containing protein [Anaerocolumna jejuensis]SHK75330.1 DNA-binding transcriptional regulator, MerR family [Anaerocolumna jejuensis DSM 15929]